MCLLDPTQVRVGNEVARVNQKMTRGYKTVENFAFPNKSRSTDSVYDKPIV